MKDRTTVIADTETGGVKPQHPTIQIAAIAVRGWDEIESFEAKIRFDEATAEREALELNGYDAGVWAREAVPMAEAVRALDGWLEPHRELEKVSKRTGGAYKVARVAAWNARFDCGRLERAFKAEGRFLPAQTYEALDLLQVARAYFWERPGPENMKLGTVASWLGIDAAGAHDALADCRIAMRVAREVMG